MDFFPAFLDLRGRSCLLVGGGKVALRKARLLASAGAHLTVVAPYLTDELKTFAATHSMTVKIRTFRARDVAGFWLVVSATGVPEIERAVFDAASAARVFCNGVDDKRNCSYITPAIVDRSPVVVAISSGGAAPVLARRIRTLLEQQLPQGLSALAALARDWRGRVAESVTSLLGRRRFWESIFDGPAATFAIDGDIASAEAIMESTLHASTMPDTGEAWLVGAGPGDPGLLTLKALQALQAADVIVHDRLVSSEVLALARRDADLIPVGKVPGCNSNSQEEINALLVSLLDAGKRVCRLKGGDPYIFGRGGEEVVAVREAGYPISVIPGITSASGCSASAGIPLTHRGVSQAVVFVTAHGQNSIDQLDWPSLARDKQTLAFYMGVQRFPELMNNLVNGGRRVDTPIAIVENGTRPEQRVVRGTLGQLTLLAAAHAIRAPAMLFVGEVAAMGANDASRTAVEYDTHNHPIAEKG